MRAPWVSGLRPEPPPDLWMKSPPPGTKPSRWGSWTPLTPVGSVLADERRPGTWCAAVTTSNRLRAGWRRLGRAVATTRVIAQLWSISRSQPLARRQSRCTVLSVTPRVCAVSFSVRPAKKRHSTTFTSRGSTRSSCSSACSRSRNRAALLDAGDLVVVQRLLDVRATALLPGAPARLIDHDVPHGAGGDREEVALVVVLRAAARGRLQLGLVDQAGGAEPHRLRPPAELAASDPAQIGVEARDVRLEGRTACLVRASRASVLMSSMRSGMRD